MLVLQTVQFAGLYLLTIQSSESWKLVNRMCVEDPFSQIRSHISSIFTVNHIVPTALLVVLLH